MLLLITADRSSTLTGALPDWQRRAALMAHLSVRRCTWLLLLLLLLLALTVQLSMGARKHSDHVAASSLRRIERQTLDFRADAVEKTRKVLSFSQHFPVNATVKVSASKGVTNKLQVRKIPKREIKILKSKQATITKTMARPSQQLKSPEKTATTPKLKATPSWKVQTTTSTPKTLRQRIEEASDASLHSQMLAKLSSLGSSVTEAQVLNAASKCGGKKPAVRYVLNYEFVRAAEHLCTGELLALIAVHSNAKNIDRRATIRRTWGSLRYIGRFRIEVAFFLGRPASGDSDVESGAKGAQLDALIEAESRRFGDIVQLNFTENYRNLTIKHLGVYEWLLRHCKSAQHLVKVDDDTFTDVAHLATFLSRGAPSGFYCSATRGAKPQRVRRGVNWKWTVSIAEFDGKFYPTYCEGYGYVIHTRHIADIYLCSLFKQFFWIDDVHVTGILASLMDTPVNRFWRGHGYSVLVPSLASELIMDYIFLTAYNSEFFPGLWGKLWHAALRHSLDVAL